MLPHQVDASMGAFIAAKFYFLETVLLSTPFTCNSAFLPACHWLYAHYTTEDMRELAKLALRQGPCKYNACHTMYLQEFCQHE